MAGKESEKWEPLERNLWINENSHNAKEEEDGSDERIEGGWALAKAKRLFCVISQERREEGLSTNEIWMDISETEYKTELLAIIESVCGCEVRN